MIMSLDSQLMKLNKHYEMLIWYLLQHECDEVLEQEQLQLSHESQKACES